MTEFTQEIKRLQKLSCISLSPQEEQKLGAQLTDIIGFLGKLPQTKDISGSKQSKDLSITKMGKLTLRTIKGVRQNTDTKKLLKNVKHEIVNNSIVIKSVLS